MIITVISGSARPERQSHQVALAIKNLLEASTHVEKVHLVDVQEYNLPLLRYVYSAHPEPSPEMHEISDLLSASDAIVIVSPEHNGSYSGALKNTMDYYRKEYVGKPFGLVTVSSGRLGGINAFRNLQHYALSLGGQPFSKGLLTAEVQKLFRDGKVVDEDYQKRMDSFVQAFIDFCKLFI